MNHSHDMYKKIKQLKGERFARSLRDFHSGILEIPNIDEIIRHAGNETEPLFPYLMYLLLSNNDKGIEPSKPANPFDLLAQAGYHAFYVDSLKKQQSIMNHFAKGELLCTFNDYGRYQENYIVYAIKNNVDKIRRNDFRGKERREDDYGTSVISIQMFKEGGHIKITNRYNNLVPSAENTFQSNPDNIIFGLSAALKAHFRVDFSVDQKELPKGYIHVKDKIFKYNFKSNGIYFGDGALVKRDTIKTVSKLDGDALFERFFFDNKKKKLFNLDPESRDAFAEDFNRYYGGNRKLNTRQGNLYLEDELIIGAKRSRIEVLNLPLLEKMSDKSLVYARSLVQFKAKALQTMGDNCLYYISSLEKFEANALREMGDSCLYYTYSLKKFEANALREMWDRCLRNAPMSIQLQAKLTTMRNRAKDLFNPYKKIRRALFKSRAPSFRL